MWIHLLTTGLIDGAGGSPIPPTPTELPAGGRGSRKKRRPLIVVEVDGKEYRIPYDELDRFLSQFKKEVKQEAKKVSSREDVVELQPAFSPIIIRQVEGIELSIVQDRVDTSNNYMFAVWDGIVRRAIRDSIATKLQRREEEEFLLLIM